MANKKFTIHRWDENNNRYDNLYPETTIEQVQDLQTELDSKQDNLPTVVNDRYLHTNASTGALEWSELSQAGNVDDVKVDGTSVVTDRIANIDLATPLATKQNKIFVQVSQPSTFTTGDIWYDIKARYTITTTLTNCSSTSILPTSLDEGSSATFTVVADSGYILPDSIVVTGASYTYTKETGVVTIYNPISNISILIVCSEFRLPVGGRIFYIHNDNGATYTFYDAQGNELPTQTVAGLTNAVAYKIDGTPSADKFYVYDTTYRLQDGKKYKYGGSKYSASDWSIGAGRSNTSKLLAVYQNDSATIWYNIKHLMNDNSVSGCNDWYIGSVNEWKELQNSGLESSWFSEDLWSSSEDWDSAYYAVGWVQVYSYWRTFSSSYEYKYVAFRSF